MWGGINRSAHNDVTVGAVIASEIDCQSKIVRLSFREPDQCRESKHQKIAILNFARIGQSPPPQKGAFLGTVTFAVSAHPPLPKVRGLRATSVVGQQTSRRFPLSF